MLTRELLGVDPTIDLPAYEIGSTAAQRLLARLAQPTQLTNQEIVLQPVLTVRDYAS